jgi:hypothetical protein
MLSVRMHVLDAVIYCATTVIYGCKWLVASALIRKYELTDYDVVKKE